MTGTRIAILGHTAQLGGAEIALLRLVDALPPEWEVTVVLFTPGELEDELKQRGIAVDVVPLAPRTASQGRAGLTDLRTLLRAGRESVSFARALAGNLQTLRADLVVANSLKAAVLGSIAARHAGLPWVWHLHDRLSPDYLPAPVVTAMRILARTARHTVANSEQTARLTKLPADRVSVVYPGIPESLFSAVHRPASPPVFGLLGRISSTKGQREFLQAAALTAAAHPVAEFHIVGEALFNDQAYAEEVRSLPHSLGIEDRVRFLGWAADPTAELDRFTALVHASPVPEPFGQVIVEAMARRVPVIATQGGGVAEILTGSPDPQPIPSGGALRTPLGQLVNPADPEGLAAAMSWVLEHPDQAQSTAEVAADSARRRFSSTVTAESCSAAWTAALARSSRLQSPGKTLGSAAARLGYPALQREARPRREADGTVTGEAAPDETVPEGAEAEQCPLSVCIVTYERPAFLKRCLESLAAHLSADTQVVVVDASAATQQETARSALDSVVYIHAPQLAGWMTRSRNEALRWVSGAAVSFLDDDVVIRPGWEQAVLQAFSDPSVAAVSGRTCNGIDGEEHYDQPIGRLRADGTLTDGFASLPQAPVEVDHGIGANMSFRRSVLARLGGFRDDYPGTALREDTDIFLRVRALGGRVLFVPEAAVDHLPAPHVRGARFDTRYKLYGRRNHMVLLARNRGLGSPALRRWTLAQLQQVPQAPGLLGKARRLGVTLSGIAWGAAAAVTSAGWAPLAPERHDDGARRLRERLS